MRRPPRLTCWRTLRLVRLALDAYLNQSSVEGFLRVLLRSPALRLASCRRRLAPRRRRRPALAALLERAAQAGGEPLDSELAVAVLAARLLGTAVTTGPSRAESRRFCSSVSEGESATTKTRLHPRGGDVGVLAAGARGAAGAQLDLRLVDRRRRARSRSARPSSALWTGAGSDSGSARPVVGRKRAAHELEGDEQDQAGEAELERPLRQRVGGAHADDHAGEREQADGDPVADLDVAVAVLAPGADIATGTIASSDVAEAWSCGSPRISASAGTKTMPPPTPSRPPIAPPTQAQSAVEELSHRARASRDDQLDRDGGQQHREHQRDGALGDPLLQGDAGATPTIAGPRAARPRRDRRCRRGPDRRRRRRR